MDNDRHPIEESLYNDYQNKFNFLFSLAYEIDKSDYKDDLKEIRDLIFKKLSGVKMMIDHLQNNKILPTK